MNWKHFFVWIILTLILGAMGLVFAFANRQTILVGFLVYLPLTGGIVWLTIYRRKVWLGLWFLVFLGWLTYIGPLAAALFQNGDSF
jgi:hypothetical protein